MGRGFTLIEGLVGASVVAIVTTLLIPVATKYRREGLKQQTISHLRQISLSFNLYCEEHNGTLPRQDGCAMFSSLNPKLKSPELNDGVDEGCRGPFYNRLNHFSWQKWTRQYIDSENSFTNPQRERLQETWNLHGQLCNQFVLNLGFTGAIDSYNRALEHRARFRDSWFGGKIAAMPQPNRAALLFELTTDLPFIPIATTSNRGEDSSHEVGYPIAFREYYRYKFYRGNLADCLYGRATTQLDERKAPYGGLTVASVDGGARWMSADEFLHNCPTKAELGLRGSSPTSGYTYGNDCHGMSANSPAALSIQKIDTTVNYPMWGFGE